MNKDGSPNNRAWARFAYFLWWLVRVDPDILRDCPTLDRFYYISKAALLSAVAGIALFAWGAFFFQFWPFYMALPLTAVALAWIVLIDQFMGASRWALQGVLAEPGKTRALNGAILLRLAIGLATASATSFSATMILNKETIATQEQQDRDHANAAKREAAETEKARLWQSMLGADDAAVNQTAAEVSALEQQLDTVRQERNSAAAQLTDASLKADCQGNGGPGCRRGYGALYRAALIERVGADGDLRRASADMADLEARLADATGKNAAAVKTFRARETDYLKAAAAIDARVAREAVPPRNDPVMSYMALQKVFASPAGGAARFYSHMMLILLLTVELSYVLVAEYFGHATVYMVRLIARTKVLAAEAIHQYHLATGKLFGQAGSSPPERPTFRVISRSEDDESDGKGRQ